MTLEELLSEVRSRRLILLQHGSLWAPNTHVPMVTRRAIRDHRSLVYQLIRQADIRVCPSQDLHRRYWKYAGEGRFECEICRRIAV